MTNKKKILLAEASRTLSKIIAGALKESGYAVEICTDGLEAVKKSLEIKPDCIVSDTVLPSLDGFQFCTLIKEGSNIYNTPFVLFSADEKPLDFWTDSSNANLILSLCDGDIQPLISALEELFKSGEIDLNFFTDEQADSELKGKDPNTAIAVSAVRAMDKSKFYTNMIKIVLNLYEYVEDFDLLIRKFFTILYEIADFKVAAIIIHDKQNKHGSPFAFYYTGIEKMDNAVSKDFRSICRSDFEEQSGYSVGKIHENVIVEGIVNNPGTNANFASYRCFPVEQGEFIGTVNMASDKNNFFNYKVSSSVQFVASKIAPILIEAMKFREMAYSENKMRSAFSKFVPEEIINDLLKNDSEEKGSNNEKRKVAVLICDIRNFTSISEINQPEDVVSFLNGYFTQMVEVIKKHGGSIDKFMGDAIMALFGAPISYTDNASRAVAAAIEMTSMLPKINCSQLTFPLGVSLDIGIGIHYGEAIVGNIGCKEKTDYTVIGDTVNLASRLEGLTKQYGARIIISEAVCKKLDYDFNLLDIDTVKVKGKSKGVKVFRIDEYPLAKDYLNAYEKGLTQYRLGAWDSALSYFDKALSVRPEDKAVKLMISRCKEFIENPPENWEGAIALTSK